MSPHLGDSLRDTLDILGYAGQDGLVTVDDDDVDAERVPVWRDLRDKVGLQAAFFEDGVPVVGFADEDDPTGLAGLRRRLWNYGRVPLLVAAQPETVSAFNALTFGSGDASVGLLAQERRANLAKGLMEAFARREVEAGRWASAHAKEFRASARVDAVLLRNLRYLREAVPSSEPRRRNALDALIGGALTATYLADRGVLNVEHLDELAGLDDLRAILESGRAPTRRLFEGLAEHFNGDVFGPLPAQLKALTPGDISSVAAMLRGDDLPTGQQSLWPYDFAVLPGDLVSTVYEQLLESSRKTDATYYTPRFLVDLILDEVLPWTGHGSSTITDLSCGSGAFLSAAFQRMAFRESSQRGRELTYAELRELLTSTIFGVDKNEAAARVAVFGLYLALLEQLDPPTVWSTAVLPKLLDSNVVVSDAFADHNLSGRRFDAVVGNPPWASSLSTPASEFLERTGRSVADRQLASAFLWLAHEHLNESGRLALVLPSKPLLHNRSPGAQEFRRKVFSDLQVTAVVDLSALRRTIFPTAVAPAAVLVAGRAQPEAPEGDILHVAPHPRPLNRALEALVVTPEEISTVRSRLAQGRADIWKVLLWGSRRDLELIDRLRARYPTVKETAEERGWTFGQGFQVGGGDANDARHMIGRPMLDLEQVMPLRIDRSVRALFEYETLHRPRDPKLFQAPVVVVRRTLFDGQLAAVLLDEDTVFSNAMLGIAGPSEDRGYLAALAATIVSSLGHYWHFLTSASWGVERDFVELNEHLDLPLPLPSRALRKRFERLALGKTPPHPAEIDDAVFDLFALSEIDRMRIRDRMATALGRFRQPGDVAPRPIDAAVDAYEGAVSDALRRTLPQIGVATASFRQGSYQAVTVTFRGNGNGASKRSASEIAAVDVDAIVQATRASQARTTGVVSEPAGFFLDEDTIYIVKTVEADRWSRDAALDDADRIIASVTAGG